MLERARGSTLVPTRVPTLVLGGSGFLGAHVVAAAGPGVVVAGRERGRHPPGVAFHELDALVPDAAERVLDSVRPGRVVLCTALSDPGLAATYPVLARTLNAEFPRRVAHWCRQNGVRLVHISTDLVFGASEPPPEGFREHDEPAPISEYGRSKAAGERAVLEACPAALVVRLPLLYGESFGRERGASDSLLAAIARGEIARLFTDEWRTPLDVGDAAQALVELAWTSGKGILHVAGPERVTRYELGLCVLTSRGIPPEEARDRIRPWTRSEAGLEATRPRDASLDASRALTSLSVPLRSMREALGSPGTSGENLRR